MERAGILDTAKLTMGPGDDHLLQGLRTDLGDVRGVGNRECDEPGVGRDNQMDLVTLTPRFDGGARQVRDEGRLVLARDELGLRALVEAPLAQLDRKSVV